MATQMIDAIGDRGIESTPANEAVCIPSLPLGVGNLVIPATIRALPQVYGKPKRLTGISRKGGFPVVTWRDAQGRRASCCIRNVADARDALWGALPARSRARLVTAVVD